MKSPHSQDSAAPMSRSMLLLTLSLNFLKRKCGCLSFGFAVSAFQGFILGGESLKELCSVCTKLCYELTCLTGIYESHPYPMYLSAHFVGFGKDYSAVN